MQLAYGKNRFLFMGDAEEKAEEDMIKENYDLECDVLKVGHHGSYTATGDNFLTKADPAYAVISAGKTILMDILMQLLLLSLRMMMCRYTARIRWERLRQFQTGIRFIWKRRRGK